MSSPTAGSSVHGGDQSYPLREGIDAVTLGDLCAELGEG